MEEIVIEHNGDLEVVVDNSKFLISSAKMASLSPKFDNIFGHCRMSAGEITFPTSAEVFHRVAQSAHGYFVPQSDISLDVLLGLASVVSKYEVPTNTALYALVNFSFVVQTIRPGQVSMGKLVTLLQIAKALHPTKLATLLLDVFDGRPKALDWSFSHIEAHECVLLLVNILMRITKARDGLVKAIITSEMTHTLDSCFGFFQELRQVAGWILQDQPSLHEIQLRLEQFQICEEPSSDETLVQDALKRCWTVLRSAREEAKEFVQQFVVQGNQSLRTSGCTHERMKISGPETEFPTNDGYIMTSFSDGNNSCYGADSLEAELSDVKGWEMREDWMELASDTTSVKSCQTV